MILGLLVASFLFQEAFQDQEKLSVDGRESWCGARCLFLISSSLGGGKSFKEVLRCCDPESKSNGELSCHDIVTAAKSLNLRAMSFHSRREWLAERLPAIVLLKQSENDTGAGHYVVVVEINDEHVTIADPFRGDRLDKMQSRIFNEVWTGNCIVFEDRIPGFLSFERSPVWILFVACGVMLLFVPYQWRKQMK